MRNRLNVRKRRHNRNEINHEKREKMNRVAIETDIKEEISGLFSLVINKQIGRYWVMTSFVKEIFSFELIK